jgi:hypothetical protein
MMMTVPLARDRGTPGRARASHGGRGRLPNCASASLSDLDSEPGPPFNLNTGSEYESTRTLGFRVHHDSRGSLSVQFRTQSP